MLHVIYLALLIHYPAVCFSLPCEHSDLCLFQMIVFESLDRLGSLCCIFIYFINVFVYEESELAKIQHSPVLSCLDWDLGLGDLSRRCAVGERCHSLNRLHFLSLDPYRGIIADGWLYTTYLWLLRGKKDSDSDIKISGKWSCKGKDALQRVYISIETTWSSQKVVKAGHHAGPRLSVSQGEVLSALDSEQTIRLLQAHNQTARSRVNRIWRVVMGTWCYRCKTMDRCFCLKG